MHLATYALLTASAIATFIPDCSIIHDPGQRARFRCPDISAPVSAAADSKVNAPVAAIAAKPAAAIEKKGCDMSGCICDVPETPQEKQISQNLDKQPVIRSLRTWAFSRLFHFRPDAFSEARVILATASLDLLQTEIKRVGKSGSKQLIQSLLDKAKAIEQSNASQALIADQVVHATGALPYKNLASLLGKPAIENLEFLPEDWIQRAVPKKISPNKLMALMSAASKAIDAGRIPSLKLLDRTALKELISLYKVSGMEARKLVATAHYYAIIASYFDKSLTYEACLEAIEKTEAPVKASTKAAAKKPEVKVGSQKKPVDQSKVQQKPIEEQKIVQKTAEQQNAVQKPIEQPKVEQKPIEQPKIEQKPIEQQKAQQIATQKPVEQPKVEQKPLEQQAAPQNQQKANEQSKVNVELKVEQKPTATTSGTQPGSQAAVDPAKAERRARKAEIKKIAAERMGKLENTLGVLLAEIQEIKKLTA